MRDESISTLEADLEESKSRIEKLKGDVGTQLEAYQGATGDYDKLREVRLNMYFPLDYFTNDLDER